MVTDYVAFVSPPNATNHRLGIGESAEPRRNVPIVLKLMHQIGTDRH
jgi:hypothetical protein